MVIGVSSSRIRVKWRMQALAWASYHLKLADAVLQPSKDPTDVLNFQIRASAASSVLTEINKFNCVNGWLLWYDSAFLPAGFFLVCKFPTSPFTHAAHFCIWAVILKWMEQIVIIKNNAAFPPISCRISHDIYKHLLTFQSSSSI